MEHLFAEGLATPINVISQQSTRDGCRKVGEGKIAPGLEFPLRKSNVNDIHGAELNHYPHPIIAREGWAFLRVSGILALLVWLTWQVSGTGWFTSGDDVAEITSKKDEGSVTVKIKSK